MIRDAQTSHCAQDVALDSEQSKQSCKYVTCNLQCNLMETASTNLKRTIKLQSIYPETTPKQVILVGMNGGMCAQHVLEYNIREVRVADARGVAACNTVCEKYTTNSD